MADEPRRPCTECGRLTQQVTLDLTGGCCRICRPPLRSTPGVPTDQGVVPPKKPVAEDTSGVVRHGVEQACGDFTKRIASFGFVRTKKMFWSRRRAHTVELVHLHRGGSSYGKPINYSVDFRIHLGIRVLNDTFPAIALNGPQSDDPQYPGTWRYHLRFNAKTGSTYDKCIDELVRFVVQQGEPWFERFKPNEALLTSPDSPLDDREKYSLREAIDGSEDDAAVLHSLRELGIKTRSRQR